jgi:hypothetical protein
VRPIDSLGVFGTMVGLAMVPALGSGGLDAWETTSIAGVIGSGMGITLWSARRRISDAIEGEGYDEIRPARPEEAEAIHSLAVESFGPAVTDKATIASFIRRNPRIFWVLTDQSEDATISMIKGYGCLIPLSHVQQRAIEGGQFNLESLTPSNIPRYRSNIAAIYIGAIVGRRRRSRAKILGFMEAQARSDALKSKTRTVYAKAVTNDGLRTVVRRKFDPVFPGFAGMHCYFKKAVVDVTTA